MGITMDNERPYHSKRPHRKSRRGCTNCKRRKVKCDEARPQCKACTLRKEACGYPSRTSDALALVASPPPSRSSVASSVSDGDAAALIVDEPLYTPSGTDATDMKLLWFFTTKGYDAFSVEAGRQSAIDSILQVRIPQLAFANPFLMDCILGLASLQMQYLEQDVSNARAIAYRARAFAGYRKAIEEARPESFPALLACSLLLCALASQMFREPDTKPLYIIDWMVVWRGIGLIVSIIKPKALFESGMAILFARPPIDLDQSARFIPNNLLFMVTSIKEGDPDFNDIDTYYNTLKYLGSLYVELDFGFGPILDLRVVTWFTFLPMDFVELARQKRPRALAIIAHYLTFIRLCGKVWWLDGIAEKEIWNIYSFVGEEWESFLRVPILATTISDKTELGRLILGDSSWHPESRYEGIRDARTKALSWVDDQGRIVALGGEHLIRADTGERATWNINAKGKPTQGEAQATAVSDLDTVTSHSSPSPGLSPGFSKG